MLTISPEKLKQRIANGEPVHLLDVRQPDEHAAKNIAGSLLIPLGTLPVRMNELEQWRDQEIIIYCRSGGRSAQACQFLDQHGFKTVNLEGGMLAW
jgi:rhodanese-related sulfurtransferase